jgi:hypothetical protein
LSILEISPPFFYVFDFNGRTANVYNEYWEYQRSIALGFEPSYSINVNGTIYVATSGLVRKFNANLNTITSLTSRTYRGIYFNPSNRLIYLANRLTSNIDVINENLSSNTTLTVSGMSPWFITGYNGQIVAGNSEYGNVYFFQGNVATVMPTRCTGRVSSILFDNYNQMLVLCETNSYLYIYYQNGTFTGTSYQTCNKPIFMDFDFRNRLVITCPSNILIYY